MGDLACSADFKEATDFMNITLEQGTSHDSNMPSHSFPASAVQRQMRVVEKLHPGIGIYNEDASFWVDGPIDFLAFRAAWQRLADRHEVLRYAMREENDMRIAVAPHVDVLITQANVSDEESALEWGRDFAELPYDPAHAPLFRVGIASFDATHHLLVIGFHHAIMDAASLGTLLAEFTLLYSAAKHAEHVSLPTVEVTYGDYLREADTPSMRQKMATLAQEVAEQLTRDGGSTNAEIPPDHPRPRVRAGTGKVVEVQMPDDLLPRIREFAAGRRCTPFTVLLAGMVTLLRRHTQLDDMILGIGSAGRTSKYHDAVGPFASFLPMRFRLPESATFTTVMQVTAEVIDDIPAAQFAPFSDIVQAVEGGSRDPSRPPLVQVVFNAPPSEIAGDIIEGCTCSWALLPRTRARVDLLVNLEHSLWGSRLTCEYDDTILDRETITTLLTQLGTLIDSGISHPYAEVDTLNLNPTSSESAKLLIGSSPHEHHGRIVEVENAWAKFSKKDVLIAASSAPSVLLPDGTPAAAGVQGLLHVGGWPIPGVRVRQHRDGTIHVLFTSNDIDQETLSEDAHGGAPITNHLVWLCRELLDNPGIGANDDFFAAGGHSMTAARMVQSLEEEFGVEVPLLIVFEHPIISDLSAHIARICPEITEILTRVADLNQPDANTLETILTIEPAVEDVKPRRGDLSIHERPFWLMEQFAPRSALNTLTLLIRGTGQIDTVAFRRALTRVTDREEILRARYLQGEFMTGEREILNTIPVHFEILAGDSLEATTLARRWARTGFDIEEAPLWRCAIIRDANNFSLLLSYHHLIMDYWGVTHVMLPALSVLYSEETGGVPVALPTAEGYRAAIERECQWRKSGRSKAELAYWRGELAGFELSTLPTDHPRSAMCGFNGESIEVRIAPSAAAEVQRAVSEQGITLFVAVAAAVAAALRTHSGDDVTFLTPTENRRTVADTRVMGTFVNLVALRIRLSDNMTWRELVAQSRERVSSAYSNQSTPISEAFASVGKQDLISSGEGRYLVLNVLEDGTGLNLRGCTVHGGEIVQHDSATNDLELSVLSGTHGLSFTMKFRTGLWEESTIHTFLDHVCVALKEIAHRPDTRLCMTIAEPAGD